METEGCGKMAKTLHAALELGGEVVRGSFLEKDLGGELELARLMEVKMEFGSENREEEHSKERKQDLHTPGVKRERGAVQRDWRRRRRADCAAQCVLNDELETRSIIS